MEGISEGEDVGGRFKIRTRPGPRWGARSRCIRGFQSVAAASTRSFTRARRCGSRRATKVRMEQRSNIKGHVRGFKGLWDIHSEGMSERGTERGMEAGVT